MTTKPNGLIECDALIAAGKYEDALGELATYALEYELHLEGDWGRDDIRERLTRILAAMPPLDEFYTCYNPVGGLCV